MPRTADKWGDPSTISLGRPIEDSDGSDSVVSASEEQKEKVTL
jgi:hypothetical protein